MSTFHLDPQIDRWFDQFNRLFGFDGALSPRSVAPSSGVSITRGDEGWKLEVDLPGMQREGIDIELAQGVLTLRAQRELELPEGYTALHRERKDFAFERSWRLPEEVDAEAIEASFEDGRLTLTLPRKAEQAPRKIQLAA